MKLPLLLTTESVLSWTASSAWLGAQEHTVVADLTFGEETKGRATDEGRRREWAAKPPEERIAGRLQFWLAGQRRKGREPDEAELVAKRTALLAELTTPSGPASG